MIPNGKYDAFSTYYQLWKRTTGVDAYMSAAATLRIPTPHGKTVGSVLTVSANDNLSWDVITESEPAYSASPAASITASDITDWNNKFNEADTASYIADTFGMSYEDNSYINESNRVELEEGVSTYTVPDGLDQFSNASNLTLFGYVDEDAVTPNIALVAAPQDWNEDYFEGVFEGETWSIQLGGKDGPVVTIPATAFANKGIVDINLSQEVVDVTMSPLDSNYINDDIARTSQLPTPDGVTITASNGVWSATFSEADPVFSASPAASITASDITNWNSIISMPDPEEGRDGDVLTVNSSGVAEWAPIPTFTESDPVFEASAAASITASDISAWNGKQDALTAGSNITISGNTISAAFTFTESDPVYAASPAASITASDISNWNAIKGVPSASEGSDGDVLTIDNGSIGWSAPQSEVPTYSYGNVGQVLGVIEQDDRGMRAPAAVELAWVDKPNGSATIVNEDPEVSKEVISYYAPSEDGIEAGFNTTNSEWDGEDYVEVEKHEVLIGSSGLTLEYSGGDTTDGDFAHTEMWDRGISIDWETYESDEQTDGGILSLDGDFKGLAMAGMNQDAIVIRRGDGNDIDDDRFYVFDPDANDGEGEVVGTIAYTSDISGGGGLPTTSTASEGDVLTVSGGSAVWAAPQGGVPSASGITNGYVLTASSGSAVWGYPIAGAIAYTSTDQLSYYLNDYVGLVMTDTASHSTSINATGVETTSVTAQAIHAGAIYTPEISAGAFSTPEIRAVDIYAGGDEPEEPADGDEWYSLWIGDSCVEGTDRRYDENEGDWVTTRVSSYGTVDMSLTDEENGDSVIINADNGGSITLTHGRDGEFLWNRNAIQLLDQTTGDIYSLSIDNGQIVLTNMTQNEEL